jgi:hypothetical protein
MLIYKFDFSKKNKDNFELTVEFLTICMIKEILQITVFLSPKNINKG